VQPKLITVNWHQIFKTFLSASKKKEEKNHCKVGNVEGDGEFWMLYAKPILETNGALTCWNFCCRVDWCIDL